MVFIFIYEDSLSIVKVNNYYERVVLLKPTLFIIYVSNDYANLWFFVDKTPVSDYYTSHIYYKKENLGKGEIVLSIIYAISSLTFSSWCFLYENSKKNILTYHKKIEKEKEIFFKKICFL